MREIKTFSGRTIKEFITGRVIKKKELSAFRNIKLFLPDMILKFDEAWTTYPPDMELKFDEAWTPEDFMGLLLFPETWTTYPPDMILKLDETWSV